MKNSRLFKNIMIVFMRCILLSGCKQDGQYKPGTFSYGEYSGNEKRKEVLNINLFSDQTLHELSAQNVDVEVYDYTDINGRVDIEFITDTERLRFTSNTFSWHRNYAEWFGIVSWGGISVYDNHIAITHNGNIHVISLPDLKVEKTINIVGLPSTAVITNSIKTDNGWLVMFATKGVQGLSAINENGVYTGPTIPVPYTYVCSYNNGEAFPVSKTSLSFAQDNDEILLYDGIGFKHAHFGRTYALNIQTGWFAKINYYNFAEYQDFSQRDKYIDYYILNFETVEHEEYNPHIMAVIAVDESTKEMISYYTFEDDIIPDGFFENGYNRFYSSGFDSFPSSIKVTNPNIYHSVNFDFDKETVESISAPVVTEKSIAFYNTEDWYLYDRHQYVIVERNTEYFDTDHTEFILRCNQGQKAEKLLYSCSSADNHLKQIYFDENGNAVVYTDYDYIIFDNNMTNALPVFQLSNYIELGENITEAIANRTVAGIYSDKKSTVISYYEMPAGDDIYLDILQDDWQLKPVYCIAIIDNTGNIRKYETDVHVLKFGDNICDTSISMDNKHTIRIQSDFNHATKRIYFEGTLDINSGQYTPIISFSLS